MTCIRPKSFPSCSYDTSACQAPLSLESTSTSDTFSSVSEILCANTSKSASLFTSAAKAIASPSAFTRRDVEFRTSASISPLSVLVDSVPISNSITLSAVVVDSLPVVNSIVPEVLESVLTLI